MFLFFHDTNEYYVFFTGVFLGVERLDADILGDERPEEDPAAEELEVAVGFEVIADISATNELTLTPFASNASCSQ